MASIYGTIYTVSLIWYQIDGVFYTVLFIWYGGEILDDGELSYLRIRDILWHWKISTLRLFMKHTL